MNAGFACGKRERKMSLKKNLAMVLVAALLAACGGGGGDSTPAPAPAPSNFSCFGPGMTDIVDGLRLISVNTTGIQPHNCRLAGVFEGAPVPAGKWAVKISLKPGDCGANSGYDDCKNDRARFELSEDPQASTHGQKLVREFKLYLPKQERLRPKGDNIMFLSQLNFGDSKSFGTLAFLEVGADGDLYVRTQKGFTWEVQQIYPAYKNPYDKWIGVRYEIDSTTADTGSFKVYVDGKLIVDQVRPTLPSKEGLNYLRVGIYTAFLSQATEPYVEQVIYYDQIKGK